MNGLFVQGMGTGLGCTHLQPFCIGESLGGRIYRSASDMGENFVNDARRESDKWERRPTFVTPTSVIVITGPFGLERECK